MVYDVFPFFNELDILKLRLGVMDPYVDRFVIEEAAHTFSGLEKELVFDKNREMFAEYLPKIDYIVVSDSPPEMNPHQRDYYQKNHLLNGLKEAGEDDVIIFSDVDEIPNPLVLEKIIAAFDPAKIYHLAQRMFHGYLNREEVSAQIFSITREFEGIERLKWLGTKVFAKRSIPEAGIVYIREADVSSPLCVRVDEGGWHFSYMGGHGEKDVAKRVSDKIISAAHQEYNDPDTLAEISDKVILGRDFLGSTAQFARVEIDESFPLYLRENLTEYEHLILPPISENTKRMTAVAMLVRRFFRKATRRIKRYLRVKTA
ncbi:MAG: glycosyl transferase GT17 family protein [Lachnospiraceae bacterium]|jgi:beta-1,4-mannosyl-glycoprotein beta-1,4-N-acetylglucosaminyltransferase|nr:glycosyl transferase GT17 family protein [Lachnospiraceae bacterium]